MSAENYIVIIREQDRKYRGRMAFYEDTSETVRRRRVVFAADTLEEALLLALNESCEYPPLWLGDDGDQYVI